MKFRQIIILLFCMSAANAYCQKIPMVSSRDSKKHFGEVVRLRGALISNKLYGDSVAVLNFGENSKEYQYTVFFIRTKGGPPVDQKLINFFKDAKSTVEGLLLPVNNMPVIIIHNLEKVHTELHIQ